MALTHKPKKNLAVIAKNATKNTMSGFFAGFSLTKEIDSEGEFLALVKSSRDNEDTGQMIITLAPFEDSFGKRVFYEDVLLFIDRTCSPNSAAGQFLDLFSRARHWGDVHNRIVGIEIKFNKKDKKYKNVVRVYETDADELIFDDEHMFSPITIPDVDNDEEVDEEDNSEVRSPRKSVQALDDEEDEEDDLLEDEE